MNKNIKHRLMGVIFSHKGAGEGGDPAERTHLTSYQGSNARWLFRINYNILMTRPARLLDNQQGRYNNITQSKTKRHKNSIVLFPFFSAALQTQTSCSCCSCIQMAFYLCRWDIYIQSQDTCHLTDTLTN